MILLIKPLGTKFNEIRFLTQNFQENAFEKSFAKWQLFCPGLNVLNYLIEVHRASTISEVEEKFTHAITITIKDNGPYIPSV